MVIRERRGGKMEAWLLGRGEEGSMVIRERGGSMVIRERGGGRRGAWLLGYPLVSLSLLTYACAQDVMFLQSWWYVHRMSYLTLFSWYCVYIPISWIAF